MCVRVRSRRGTSIRLLSYDGQGYWLAQKRLSKADSMVAGIDHRPKRWKLMGAIADGSRRCIASPRRADVAAGERTEVKGQEDALFPCVPRKSSFILLGNERVSISRAGHRPGRHPLYTCADRAPPWREPPQVVGSSVRSLAVAAGQRGIARHGVPGPVADAGARRSDHVAAGQLRAP